MLFEELDYGDRLVIETTDGISYDGVFYGTNDAEDTWSGENEVCVNVGQMSVAIPVSAIESLRKVT